MTDTFVPDETDADRIARWIENARAELQQFDLQTMRWIKDRADEVERLSGGPWWVFAGFQEWMQSLGSVWLCRIVGPDRVRLIAERIEQLTMKEVA